MAISAVGAAISGLTMSGTAAVRQDSDFAARMDEAVAKTETAAKTTGQKTLTPEEDKKMREACRGMEAVFLNMMLSQMRATVPKAGLTGSSNQEETMRSMLDTEMTKNLAEAGGIGLADMIYRQLLQEKNVLKPNQVLQKG